VFDGGSHIALIASTAPGDLAGGIGAGAPARQVHSRARRLVSGVWLGPRLRGGARYVYGIRGSLVRFVAIASAADVSSTARLRADFQAAGL
jgi:hypothetical protein